MVKQFPAAHLLEIPGARFVGNDQCFQCHTQITRAFKASPHARMTVDNTDFPGGTDCESCHGPASEHVKVGGARFIINPLLRFPSPWS